MILREMIATDRPLSDAQHALHGHFTLRATPKRRVRRTYLDTFDRRLRVRGLTLSAVDSQQALWRRDGMPLARGVDAQGAAHGRALDAIAELTLGEQSLDVLDEREKTVCRIILETPEQLRTRVRLIGLRGYEQELRRVHELLLAAGGFEPASLSLVDEVVLAAGGNPAGASIEVEFSFERSTRAELAAVEVLSRLLELINANIPGVLDGRDPEFLHDYRVAIRRTRAVIRQLRGVLPSEQLPALSVEFRRLQAATSQTRDLEVFLAQFEQLRELVPLSLRGNLDPLRGVLRAWHAASREHMERELSGEHARRLLEQWGALLETLPELPADDRPDAARPIAELAGVHIRRLHRRMVRMGRKITPSAPPQAYHELRKQGKELRYLLELFAAPLYPPEAVQGLIGTLKALQDVLGEHQDRMAQADTLRRVSDHVLAQAPDGAALLAMGVLAERLDASAEGARARFAASFRGFSSEAQCKLVSSTYR